ncbi:MAG: ATP-binding cassette domain-containing protein [Betaproteobacteria bacterium]|nr:ATP-binding cassette domain-containing protein [Betaproteobacteria bacterium]
MSDTDAAKEVTLRASNLSRNYGDKRAVRDVELILHRGEVLGLLGLNGAGKSTTMQMLTGNLSPTTGAIHIGDVDLLARPAEAKRRLGYLPETPPLYKEFKVDEYLRLAARLHRVPKAQVNDAVSQAKRRCGLAEVGGRMIATLSKGYQQRVGIAQAIVHLPDVVILDEPTVGLDPNQRKEVRELITELGERHSVILSTHLLEEAETLCDRVQIIDKGRIVYNDSIESLQQFRASQSLHVGLRQMPALAVLAGLPGVAEAQMEADGYARIVHAPDRDPTDVIVRAAVENDWGLHHLSRDHASLTDVFSEITKGASSANGEQVPA